MCVVLLMWVNPAWSLDLEKQGRVSADIVQIVEIADPDTEVLEDCVTADIERNEDCEIVFDVIIESIFNDNPDYYVASQNYE